MMHLGAAPQLTARRCEAKMERHLLSIMRLGQLVPYLCQLLSMVHDVNCTINSQLKM